MPDGVQHVLDGCLGEPAVAGANHVYKNPDFQPGVVVHPNVVGNNLVVNPSLPTVILLK